MVEEAAKLAWLKERLPAFVDAGEVLVFASQKARVEMVLEQLKTAGFRWRYRPSVAPASACHCIHALLREAMLQYGWRVTE